MSTQSSGGWHDQESSPGVTSVPSKEKEEVEEVEEGETMPGSFEPVHRESSLPWKEVAERFFDASCKLDYIVYIALGRFTDTINCPRHVKS